MPVSTFLHLVSVLFVIGLGLRRRPRKRIRPRASLSFSSNQFMFRSINLSSGEGLIGHGHCLAIQRSLFLRLLYVLGLRTRVSLRRRFGALWASPRPGIAQPYDLRTCCNVSFR